MPIPGLRPEDSAPCDGYARTLPWTAVVLVLLSGVLLVARFKVLLLSLALSVVIACLLAPVLRWMDSRGIPRSLAFLLVHAPTAATLALIVLVAVPACVREAESILRMAPSFYSPIASTQVEPSPLWPSLPYGGLASGDRLRSLAAAIVAWVLPTHQARSSYGLCFLFALLVAFFVLRDGPRLRKSLLDLVPNRHFEAVLGTWYRVERKVGLYLRCQVIAALALGALCALALYLLAIPCWGMLGLLAGAACLIPYFGAFLGALPPIFTALLGGRSIEPIVGIALAFATIRLLDEVILSPALPLRHVRLHPATVAIAVLAGGIAAGMPGILMAVPAVGSAKIALEEVQKSLRIRSYLGRTQPAALR
ncbi:MAG: AI-2E family transporter [candidate division KSB1 bacterium]|nr:AI-2E family transporter [candidate division KSB1 bacterium]